MKFNSLIKRFICDIEGKFIFINLSEFQAFKISEKVKLSISMYHAVVAMITNITIHV